MEAIRVGVYNFHPFLYVDESNNVAGILAPLIYNLYYFIINKVNTTFVLSPINSVDFCADNGVCTGSLILMQKNEVDFSHKVGLSGLNHVGINLTLTPIIMEENCYLSYNSKLQVSLTSSSFFDFFSSFQWTFWILTVCSFFVFIMVNNVSLKFKRSVSLVQIFWSHFDYVLGQNYITNCAIQKESFFMVFIIFQLLVNKLLMASLRTGLVQHSEYLKLESFHDILKYNFTVRIAYPTVCNREFQKSLDPVVRKVRIEHNVYQGIPTHEQIYQALRKDGTVTCINDVNFHAAKNFACFLYQAAEEREPLRKSERTVFRCSFGFNLNKLASAKKLKIIKTGLYSAFETGCISSRIINKITKRCFLKSDAAPSCINHKYDSTEIKFIPISMAYLKIPFVIFFFGLIISVSTFIILQCKFYIHQFLYRRSLSTCIATTFNINFAEELF